MRIGICGPVYIPLLSQFLHASSTIDVVGMAGTLINHQITALLQRGFEVHVYSVTPELTLGEYREWHGEQLHIYLESAGDKAHQLGSKFLEENTFIKDAIMRSMPDLIHVHWQYEWKWTATELGFPVLLTCHDTPLQVFKAQSSWLRAIRLAVAALGFRKAKCLTAVSPYTANSLKLLTNKKVTVIPNFEPAEVFSLYKPNRKMGNQINITMINNGFYKRKNVAKGIEAFVAFCNYHPSAQLHLYGAQNGLGEDADVWCRKNKIKANIHFHGEVPYTELMKALSRADIFLHTSLEESCPMVLIEAMAMGIPVVAGKHTGGVPWMLKNGGGKLVDVRDKNKIAIELLHFMLPGYYKQVSNQAREVAIQLFSSDTVINQYIEAYKQVLSA